MSASQAGEAIPVGAALGILVELAGEVDTHLSPEQRGEVIAAAVPKASTRCALAAVLRERPELLRTGRPPAPAALAALLAALRRAGAENITLPRCGECDRQDQRLHTRSGGRWICSSCYRPPSVECAGCGQHRPATRRDRDGRPRCWACPDIEDDPTGALVDVVTGLDASVSTEAVTTAIGQAAKRPAVQRRMANDVLAHPEVLTSEGDRAPTMAVLRFIDALVAAGATTIVRPRCARCGEVKAIRKWRGERRVCSPCYSRTGAQPCGRCGNTRPIATRDPDTGAAICAPCRHREPSRQEECRGCGRRRLVAVRLDDGPRCKQCRPRDKSTCESCGRTTTCSVSRATGQSRCASCESRWTRCSGCGALAAQRGGTLTDPLCARCVNPDPEFWGRCPSCTNTWQLTTRPCQRCTLAHRVHELLGDAPALEALRRALIDVDRPDSALRWLSQPHVGDVLGEVARGQRELSHEQLDDLPAGPALAHLRAVLIATAALPERDDRLADLERWVHAAVDARPDPGERQALRGYATWHHLRRLRQRINGRGATTYNQDRNVRSHVQAAVALLDWLAQQETRLEECPQALLDRWTGHPSYHRRAAAFLRWAIKHRHAPSGLTLPEPRWAGPTGPHRGEQRWNDAHRLFSDTSLDLVDRVAGLLLLLYAQRLDTIAALTINDIGDDNGQITLTLGDIPVLLPEPLDTLVGDLISSRSASRSLSSTAPDPWLFPGRRPGHHLSSSHLGTRLRSIGLHPDRDRATALFTLAGQVDAPILAKTLGISVDAATAWQRAASGDWMTYASDLARRHGVRSRL